MADDKRVLLVVDDEPGIADLVREVGEQTGYRVAVAADGNAFVDQYHRTSPSIIFLDLKLPGYDGVELLRFLGENDCQATVIIASGSDPRTLAAAHAVGKQYELTMGPTLSKPLKVGDIEGALTRQAREDSRNGPDELRRAIDHDEITVHFQPKIDLLARDRTRMIGVEALARWALPDGGWVYPDEFIPLARDVGMMNELTKIVADKTFAATRSWLDSGLNLTAAINLDGSMLGDRALPDILSGLADKHGVPCSRVTLEITESAAMEAPAATMDILTRFRLKDFNVSLDDFGTGYSSLVQLYRLPFNELKIDKSFVMDIGMNTEADIIVDTLALLGSKLGLKVCAEGIETGHSLQRVRDSGCDFGQGYLFSRPVEAEMIEVLARQWQNAPAPGSAAGAATSAETSTPAS